MQLQAVRANLGFLRNDWLGWKVHLCGIEDSFLLQDAGLRQVVAKWLQTHTQQSAVAGTYCVWPYLLAIECLIEDDSQGPDVHLRADLWRLLPQHKALRRKVPAQCLQ